MLKLMTLATLATLALATAASAEDSVRVSVVGKSTAQIHAEIVSAARKVCVKAVTGESLILDAYGRCMKGSVDAALDQLNGSAVAQAGAMRLAQR